MTNHDLDTIETTLKVRLPVEYRTVMVERHDEIASKTLPSLFDGPVSYFDRDLLYLRPAKLIRINQREQGSQTGTGGAFPGWEKEFVLIGDNGSGDYRCVRIDGTPGVFEIGSDAEGQPARLSPSLTAYIDEEIKEYEHWLRDYGFAERRTPSRGVSSFDPNCPVDQRIAIFAHLGPALGRFEVVYQGDDCNLSAKFLSAQGLEIAGFGPLAEHVVALLLHDLSGRISCAATAEPGSPRVDLEAKGMSLDHGGRGYWYVQLNVVGSAAQVIFDGLIGEPRPTSLAVDWEPLCRAIGTLYEHACPGGVTVQVKPPDAAIQRRSALEYGLSISIVDNSIGG